MKKVLIITYYWPPAGGPGVQRVLKFAKYLPHFGWQPIILTVKKGEYPAIDETLAKDIPENCKVYKTNSIEPNFLYKKFTGTKNIPVAVLTEKNLTWKKKLANWIRLNLFIPDAKIGWMPFAVREGKKIIEREKPDIIFSSSPPPTVHLIAKKLAKCSGIKWVADFRDPWTDIDYYQKVNRSKLAETIDELLEEKVLKSANNIVTISESMAIRFSHISNKICNTIYNGFDSEDFLNYQNNIADTKKFTILYVGNLGNNRNPEPLLDTITDLINENTIDRKKIEIIFIGRTSNRLLLIKKKYSQLSIIFKGYMQYKATIDYIMKTDVLLLLINNIANNEGIITSKIFSYLPTGNYILAFGPEKGEVDKILTYTKTGQIFSYYNKDRIKNTLINLYEKWEKNIPLTTINKKEVEKYSRKNETMMLSKIFKRLT